MAISLLRSCDDSGIQIVNSRVLRDVDLVGVQRVARRRSLVRVLPGPDRYCCRPWLAGRRILHLSSRCAPGARYPRADILAAVAATVVASRANHAGPAVQSIFGPLRDGCVMKGGPPGD